METIYVVMVDDYDIYPPIRSIWSTRELAEKAARNGEEVLEFEVDPYGHNRVINFGEPNW